MKIMLFFESKEKTSGIDLSVNFNPSSESKQLNSAEQLNLYFRLPAHLDQLLDQPFNQASSKQIDRWLDYLAAEEVEL